MKANEVIEGIEKYKDTKAINSMGCSENWYNFFYAMKETFTLDEIKNMSERECSLLERLANNIQEGLY
jgi:hypothetical protein